ncbi:ABC transporter ATP-binding protein [Azonexus sp.]|uniref:ABC transporter ATP-binding protein n=1 Tax=Azonexus sp. TaxID=1872668 RepID=UPI0035B3D480
MILVDNVYKRYLTDHGPGPWILRGVSLNIPKNVSVGLIGQNGAGKSTLLRLIGGSDTPNRGRIVRNCRVSWPMGLVGGLHLDLTGRQNAKFVCRIFGHDKDMEEKISFIQDFAEIGRYFDEPVQTYSSGMRSRLKFGISLAFEFDVYISDEVTSAGDRSFKAKASAAFRNLMEKRSLIMVSHSDGTLREFCQAGIWLHQGQAHWFDDLEEALRNYHESIKS